MAGGAGPPPVSPQPPAPAARGAAVSPRNTTAGPDPLPGSSGPVDGDVALSQRPSEVGDVADRTRVLADRARVLGDVVDQSVALFRVNGVGVWIVTPGDHPFRLAAHRGLGAASLAAIERITRSGRAAGIRAIDGRRTIVLDDPTHRGTSAEVRAACRAEGIRTVCFVPIVFLDKPFAILVLYHRETRPWPQEDLDLVEAFAARVAIALQDARVHAAARAEIAARERSREEHRAGSERLRGLADASFEALVIHRDGRILDVNRAFVDLFGRSAASVAGGAVLDIFPEPERESIERHLGADTEVPFETTVILADGSQGAAELIGRTIPYADGAPARATAIRDIRKRRAIEESLTRRSLHDGLTGLPNRSLFLDRTSHALGSERPDGAPRVAVLVLDLDRFKGINESLGHAVGDRILAAVGRRFEDALRPGETLARLGDDEYAVLVAADGSEAATRRVANRLVDALSASFDAEGRDTYLSVSVGIALESADGSTAAGLLREAAIALDRAKADPADRIAVFATSMSDASIGRIQLEADLRRALTRDELEVFYQPLVDLATGVVVSHEALARWRHPTRGLLSPYAFISLAEETGLIIPLGDRILTEACRQTRAWQLTFPSDPPLAVSVNLSAHQLARPGIADSVLAVLAGTGLRASSLELEITETVVMRDPEASGLTLRGLHDLDIHLGLDDFGTGYSSLAYISRLPFDTIKVDRSFVSGVENSTLNQSIVAAVLALARGLRVDVLAEGIERQEELDAVVRLGCHKGQGYLFGKPVSAPEAEAALARVRAR
jgi:Amt family ammonium transporter